MKIMAKGQDSRHNPEALASQAPQGTLSHLTLVIPAQAGIHPSGVTMDSRFRGNDGKWKHASQQNSSFAGMTKEEVGLQIKFCRATRERE